MDLTKHSNDENTKDRKGRRRSGVDISNMVYGKVPPNAKDLEEMVLGLIMMESTALDRVLEFITDESFYAPAHQDIFRAIISLHQKGQPYDLQMVVQQLKFEGKLEMVGGPYYVTKLTNKVVSAASVDFYAKIIAQKFIAREIIRVGSEMVQNAYEDTTDVFELLDTCEKDLMEIGNKHIGTEAKGIDAVLVKAIGKIEEWRQQDTHVTGVSSGFTKLDKATRGWQNGDLIIIAARPSVGKTSFALRLARNAAFNKIKPVKVVFFSLEMNDVLLVLRILAAESGLPLYRIQTGNLDDVDMKILYQKGIKHLATLGIFIDDISGLTPLKLRAKCRRLKQKHGIGLIIIDYLQLMSGDTGKGNREQEISGISRSLKALAGELQVPVIALSQLSRLVENRTGDKAVPQLSDLRESGAIEQDADLVLFPYAPPDEKIKEDASLRDRRLTKIAKNRNGMLVTIDFNFNKDTQMWEELEEVTSFTTPAPSGLKPIAQAITDGPRMPYADKDLPF